MIATLRPRTHACESSRCPVGVVIPIYNRATIVLSTLDSIVAQTQLPARVVVVDDGSTDDSVEAVLRWIDEVAPPFETLLRRKSHETAAAARNVGLLDVEHLPLVAFLDSDDRWPSDFLERTTAALSAELRSVAATVDRRFIDAGGEVFRSDDCRALAPDPIPWMFQHGAGVASCTLLRTAAVHGAGGWNEAMDSAEDSMFFVQTALLGEWVHAEGAPVEFYHGNSAARSEEGNLSARYANALERWAIAYEEIYESLRNRYPAVKHRELRSAVGVYWYRAGKQLDRLGQHTRARECYTRAIDWCPGMIRARRRRFVSRFRSVAEYALRTKHRAPAEPTRDVEIISS